MAKDKNSETVTINRKALLGIVCMVPIIAVLLSKGEPGPMLLFIIGAGIGVFIGRNWETKPAPQN